MTESVDRNKNLYSGSLKNQDAIFLNVYQAVDRQKTGSIRQVDGCLGPLKKTSPRRHDFRKYPEHIAPGGLECHFEVHSRLKRASVMKNPSDGK